ncbi:MAG: amidohydrolase [Saprospiraceae bacterium]|nr:amidohydrolase [Saprospiraceae bacterium]
MQDLTISLVQADLLWEDKKANLSQFDRLLSQITEPTDLIILPEMFNTGFSMQATALAEDMSGPTIQWMLENARQYKATIIGSMIIVENENYFNRLIAAHPDQTLNHYDKRHLFRMANEHLTFYPGSRVLTLEIKGWKIRPLVCYDLRFPVWSRNRYNKEDGWSYDLAVYVANWPAARTIPWKTLPVARAIENQAYITTVNRIGTDGMGIAYSGDSQVINSYGEVVASLYDTETVQTIVLSRASLEKHRSVFPVGWDADLFQISD